ncbi:hypothetical protein Lser_V15G45129 [Lactuca serriola]
MAALGQLAYDIATDTSDEYLKFSERTEWTNCPNVWRCQFTRGDHVVPSVILEVVISNDLWFWHAFFGMARSNNDLNVLQASSIFDDILQGKAPEMPYVVNGNEYKCKYYLGDGIYPEYAIFVKSYTFPADDKRKMFKLAQESARKDVERAFGVFKQKQFQGQIDGEDGEEDDGADEEDEDSDVEEDDDGDDEAIDADDNNEDD